MWSGSAKFLVMYPIREDLVNFSAYVPTLEAARESWSAGGDVDELRSVFAEGCEEVQHALAALDDVLLTGIYVREPLPRWTTGRVALLGDAAHAMGPFSGSGGGVAIEDAVTLAICLRGVDSPSAAAAALVDYERRRIPRMLRLQAGARARLSYLNDDDPATPAARAGIWAGTTRIDPGNTVEYGWLYEHDPVTAAEQPIDEGGYGSAQRRRPEARRAAEMWEGALGFADRAGAWRGLRAGFERFMRESFPVPGSAVVTRQTLGGVETLRLAPPAGVEPNGVVLHLHGGGFMLGSADDAVALGSRLSRATDCEVVIPDYRLAPEAPHPAPLEDVLSVYRALVEERPDRLVWISGEDAGGCLAIGGAQELRNDPNGPAALLLVSPFCDLEVSWAVSGGAGDEWLDPELATQMAAAYVQGADPDALSPASGDLAGLPPILIAVATDEALHGDAVRLATAAEGAGVEVEFVEVDDSVHSFVLFDFLPEADELLDRFGRLVRSTAADRHLSGRLDRDA
jgi:salicylate hydroxylase